jgi:hypothetical protein
MFMNPMPTQDWYDEFYATQFWEGKAGDTPEKQLREQLLKEAGRAHDIFRFIDGSISGDGYVLEIGCAYGVIARSLGKRLGLAPLGVEPSEGARAFAGKHIRIVGKTAADLEDWNPDLPVRLVVLSNVLENIVDPEATLRILKQKLDGHLVIETPDPIFSRAVSIYHPYVYTAHAMNALLTRLGFDVIRHERDPADPQAQRFLAIAGTGKSILKATSPALFPLRRHIGLTLSNAQKRYGKWLGWKKPQRKIDDWDRETIKTLVAYRF